jgi:hypothetical protein
LRGSLRCDLEVHWARLSGRRKDLVMNLTRGLHPAGLVAPSAVTSADEAATQDRAVRQLGGLGAMLLGVGYLVIGVTYLLLPPHQLPGDPNAFLASYAESPTLLTVQYWAWALGAVVALAAVPAISQISRHGNEGWVRWTTTLAQLGFAVTAISYFTMLAVQPQRAAAYVCNQCQETVIRPALAANQNLLGLDPQGWLAFGGVGLWVLVVNLLAWRQRTLPRGLAGVGLALGLGYWLVIALGVLELVALIPIAAIAFGIILAPVWYLGVGWWLRHPPAS